FADVFQAAKGAGLRSDVHAGEGTPASSIWDALEHLQADRLIHAVSAAADPALLQHLRSRAIPLALNPGSNVRTGVVPELASYPLRRLLGAGVPLSVNTDDPALLGTTLAGELEDLAHTFDLGQPVVEALILGGLECSFLAGRRRNRLLQEWGLELEAVRRREGLDARMLGSPRHVEGPGSG
ncbi:MAG: hypothetical protein H0V09_03485, partial [Gemmatimonadetes bacterium]|nr:hypothetical protein [Gemmatimonadota bacterium]